jgi:hypothetical protein
MKKAKRPPSTAFKGTSWGTFSSCQGDDYNDEVCVFEGSKEPKAFLSKVLIAVKKLFEGAKKEMTISLLKN